MKKTVFLVIMLSIIFLIYFVSGAEMVNIEDRPGKLFAYEKPESLVGKIIDNPGRNEVSKDDTENNSWNNTEKQLEASAAGKVKVYYDGRAVVLTYHHISDKPFSGITIKPERFEEDLKILKDNGFNVISMRQMIDGMQGNAIMPPNAVVISFDDGIESFYKYAYPLLMKYNFPAVQFLITSRNESFKPSQAELNPLSPDEIREMYASGLIDIQSHTHNSHDYVYINPDLKKGAKLTNRIYNPADKTTETEEQYKARISEDLKTSRDVIYKYTGAYPDMLCFPFGSYNKAVWNAGKAVGFKYFITTQNGYNKQNSKKTVIYRIRAGDAGLTSGKLLKNIIECANEVKKK